MRLSVWSSDVCSSDLEQVAIDVDSDNQSVDMLEATAVCGFAHFRLPRCLVGLSSTSSIERGGGGGNKEENSSWPPSANAISTTVCNEAFPVCRSDERRVGK